MVQWYISLNNCLSCQCLSTCLFFFYLFFFFFSYFILGTTHRHYITTYGKVTNNKPWAYICSKGFLVGLFSGELIFGGAYYWRDFASQNELGLTIKTA